MKHSLLIVAAVLFANLRVEAEGKVDFAKDIQPILQKSCVECHGPEKPKGKLRLDIKDGALKTGDDAIIIPGKAADSEFYRRVILPTDDDDVMPAEGDPLTKAQTDLLRDWINQGAVWPDGVTLTAVKASETAPTTTAELGEHKPNAAELKAIKALESLGIAIRPIAANLNWREVNFRSQAQDSGALEKALEPLGNVLGLVEVNLAGAKIKDADLAHLKKLTNLTRLHLENTPVTDAGLEHLKGLSKLTYLNLYGTAVTDAGLEKLKGLSQLKSLYLWQTKTTDEGVAKLKAALPKVEISTGAEFKELATKTETEAEKPKEEKK